MSVISWQDKFSVGVEEFDRDHKILLDLINQFHDAYAMGKGVEALEPVFQTLLDYTQTHFRREEELMQRHGFPDLESHRIAHRDLADEVGGLHGRYLSSRNPALCIEMLAFLNNWLRFHILETDMAYKDFFVARGVTHYAPATA